MSLASPSSAFGGMAGRWSYGFAPRTQRTHARILIASENFSGEASIVYLVAAGAILCFPCFLLARARCIV